MELIRNWKSLESRTFVLALFTTFFLILPGIVGIYLYLPGLFSSLDWVKLVLLSATFTAPFAIVNTIAVGISEKRKREKNSDLFHDFVAGTIFTGLMVYLFLLVAYNVPFLHERLLAFLAICEVAILFSIWSEAKINKKRK